MRFNICAIVTVAVATAFGDVTLDGGTFSLTLGDDATVRSLVVKATGEECVAEPGTTPFFSATQERPYNNETKLIHANRRTTYPANRIKVKVKGEGEGVGVGVGVGQGEATRLCVGFETAPYEAIVKVEKGEGRLVFTLERFVTDTVSERQFRGLAMDVPPVVEFRLAQLPVKGRAHFGEWVNAAWDDRAAVGVLGVDEFADVGSETLRGVRTLTADLHRRLRREGGRAAVVAAAGGEEFLNAVARLEEDYDLPRGVASRRADYINAGMFWSNEITPRNADRYVALLNRMGIRLLCLAFTSIVTDTTSSLGDYTWRDEYPRQEADLREMIAKFNAAGIRVGLHVLQTHIGLESHYATPRADPRLGLKERFTLLKAVPATGPVDELVVAEDPRFAPKHPKCRVLKFGGELFSYTGRTSERPYRFTGVRRGYAKTAPTAHEAGTVGGVLDVSEFGAVACYLNPDTDLQEEIAAKIARLYDCGMCFCYLDGSEGVKPPFGINVARAQMRTVRAFGKMPLFCEGAAKTHFGWHLLSGANAFDIFAPEVFQQKIAEYPLAEAPIMADNFTRVDFGWWWCIPPGEDAWSGKPTTGTQPDDWEYGTSKAAGWDSPAMLFVSAEAQDCCARLDDIAETFRRWEVVRQRKSLSPAEKIRLRDPKRAFHLIDDGAGGYRPVEWKRLAVAGSEDTAVRAYLFERNGQRTVAYWHCWGQGTLELAGGRGTLKAGAMSEWTTALSDAEIRAAFAGAKITGDPLPMAKFRLVEGGWAQCAVVSTGVARVDADLAHFTNIVHRATGAVIPVVAAADVPEHGEVAGKSRILRLCVEERSPLEEDRWAIDFPDERTLRVTGSAVSCRYALDDILEREAGVVFCFAGADGTHVPSKGYLAVPRRPRQGGGKGLRLLRDFYCENPDWELSVGGKKQRGYFMHHNVHRIFPLEKYGKEPWLSELMPEKDGKRTCPKDRYDGWQVCWASEKGIAEAVKNICAHLRAHPEEKVYSLSVNDYQGYCCCARCKAANGGTFEANSRYISGYRSRSEGYYKWVNKIAAGVAAEFPDRFAGLLAYCEVTDPPSYKLHPNVVPFVCGESHSMVDEKESARRRKLFAEWNARASHVGVWDYVSGTDRYVAPRIYFRAMADFYGMKRTVCPALDAVFLEAHDTPGEGPKRWLLAKLLNDPGIDIDRALDRWYAACVGTDAAPSLKAYYALWEDFWRSDAVKKTSWYKEVGGVYFVMTADRSYLRVMDRAMLDRADRLMAEAVAAADGKGDPDQRKRAHILADWHRFCRLRMAAGGAGIWNVRPDGTFADASSAAAFVRTLPKVARVTAEAETLVRKLADRKRAEAYQTVLYGGADYAAGDLLKCAAENSNLTEALSSLLHWTGEPSVRAALKEVAADSNFVGDGASVVRGLAAMDRAPNLLATPDGEEAKELDAWKVVTKNVDVKPEGRAANGSRKFRCTAIGGWQAAQRLVPGIDQAGHTYYYAARIHNISKDRLRVRMVASSVSPKSYNAHDFSPNAFVELDPGETKSGALLYKSAGTGFTRLYLIFNNLSIGQSVEVDSLEFRDITAAAEEAERAAVKRATKRWQDEIDRVSAAGGGVVSMPAGRHRVGTLFLKNGVTLNLAKDCVLEGSTDIADYPGIPLQYAEYPEPWQALVASVGQKNVAVTGEGTISGNGPKFPYGTRLGRPRGMLLYRCRNVRLEGFRFFDLASWSCYVKECEDVTIRRVTIDAHGNANNDGFDIDSRNVLVENCEIDSDDDAIVLKSDNPDFICENVEVRNCIARSDCNIIKLGTASHGGFRNISIHGIRTEASRRHTVSPPRPAGKKSWREETWPGSPAESVPLGGIAIECVDGGLCENIVLSNIEIAACSVPIFIRGGQRRQRFYGKELPLTVPFGHYSVLRNVTIENVRAKSFCWTASSITGVPGLRLANIVLRNVAIEVPGAGEAGRVELGVPVPEKANDHPESNMFDSRMLPAYGFFIRHADGVTLENVTVKVQGSEVRPEVLTDDVTGYVRK